MEGDGPETNATMIRLCLPFDENTAGLTGYVRDAVLYMASHYGESTINVAKIAGAVGISEGVAHTVPDEKGSGIAFGPPEQGVRSGRKSRI